MLLISAAVAIGCWKFLPGTRVDRRAFTIVVSSFTNGPLFVTGNGSHVIPWKLNAIAADPKLDHREAPMIVSLGDDLGNFFQSSPPAPIDMAVIFLNFQRLGAKNAATAAVLAWESPDPIGLAALEKTLGRFDAIVMAAPLSRGAVPAAMPPAFRRASLPLTSVHGDISTLPIVNRIPLSGIILGGENAVAGFSLLEAEPVEKKFPLIVRWEDRVVFAFPLLTALQRHHVPLDAMEIRLGEFIKLGPTGPVIPLDAYGRLAVPVTSMAAYKEVSAEALIDGGDSLFPKAAPNPVILRDDQSATEPATRAYSKMLATMVATLASDHGFAQVSIYPRFSAKWEIGGLAFIVLVLTLFSGLTDFRRHLAFGLLVGLVLAAQWIAAGMASVWLPGLSMLAAILAALVTSKFLRNPPNKISPVPLSPVFEFENSPEIDQEPSVVLAPEIPVTKALVKKTATKKASTKRPKRR